jgi:hypothetical protein
MDRDLASCPGGRDAVWVILDDSETFEDFQRGVLGGELDINAEDVVGLCPVIAAVLARKKCHLRFLLAQSALELDVVYKGKHLREYVSEAVEALEAALDPDTEMVEILRRGVIPKNGTRQGT